MITKILEAEYGFNDYISTTKKLTDLIANIGHDIINNKIEEEDGVTILFRSIEEAKKASYIQSTFVESLINKLQGIV